jgi:hypothetical protein
MNLDAVVTAGQLAWKPSPDAEELATWHMWNHPHTGTFASKVGTVLYTIVGGAEDRMSVWAYACLDPSEAHDLADVTFDSLDQLREFMQTTFASHRLVLALADDLHITTWWVADKTGPLYEVAAEFLEQVLAEKLSRQDAHTKFQAQLAWVGDATREFAQA